MTSANTWPLRTVAHAADMKPRALRQWFDTGVLKLRGNDRKSTGSGHHCGISRRRALQAAITQTCNRHRMSVSYAARAASLFTDEAQPDRPPGELFSDARTFLVFRKDGPVVVKADYDASFSDLSGYHDSVVAIDLKQIVQRVDSILNSKSNIER